MADAVPSPLPDEHTITPTPSIWEMVHNMDYMAIEIQMILSALLVIYVGAHASLRRPPSAAPPADKRKGKGKNKGSSDADDKERFGPGLEASDAIVFPLIAAAVLISLYYLLKWLQDPALLNKIMRWYMSATGVVSTGLFLGNAMQVALTLAFPDYWTDDKGNVIKVDASSRRSSQKSPFPGWASRIKMSPRMVKFLYAVRHLFTSDWALRLNVWGLCSEKVSFKLSSAVGCILGFILQGMYLYTHNNALGNVIGLSVCYMSFLHMSVTSYFIGSLVLSGLFVYDIIMVFYTPFMIGVATKLDVPIKLTYATATRSSILGLGDIVVPGIFICLALRFDLWQHYERKITSEEVDLTTVVTQEQAPSNVTGGNEEPAMQEVTTVKKARREVKAPFVDPRGQWGNYFWTTSWRKLFFLGGGSHSAAALAVESVASSAFPKPYFHATLVGYLLGMLTTLAVLLVFRHGQPALLYLVPGVVGSAYLTGWWRGELKSMWRYTEDGSLDVEDVVVEVDEKGNAIPIVEDHEKKDGDAVVKTENGTSNKGDKTKKKKGSKGTKDEDKPLELLHFSITIPREESIKEE